NGVTRALAYAIAHSTTAATPARPNRSHPVVPEVMIQRGTRACMGAVEESRTGAEPTGRPASSAGLRCAVGSVVVTADSVPSARPTIDNQSSGPALTCESSRADEQALTRHGQCPPANTRLRSSVLRCRAGVSGRGGDADG